MSSIKKICRICLKEHKTLISMKKTFKNDKKEVELYKMYNTLTNLKTSPYTTKNFELCFSCVPQLCRAYVFLQLCLSSSEYFLKANSDQGDVGHSSTNNFVAMEFIDCAQKIKLDDNLNSSRTLTSAKIKPLTSHKKARDLVLNSTPSNNINNEMEDIVVKNELYSSDDDDDGNVGKEKLMVIFKKHRSKTIKPDIGTVDTVKPIERKKRTGPLINTNNLCTVCGIIIKEHGKYNQHMLSHDPNRLARKKVNNLGSFQCDICDEKFTNRQYFNKHKRMHDPDCPQCEYCGQRFATPSQFKLHTIKHTGIKPITCDICGKKSRTRSDNTVHMRFHTGERPFKCEVCEKAFHSQSARSAHVSEEHLQTKWECDICHKTCKTSRVLKIHKTTHLENCIKCRHCTEEFQNNKTYGRHLRTKHPEHQLPSCNVCGKSFINPKDLETHARFHVNVV